MPVGVHLEVAHNAFKSWVYCGKEDTRVSGPWEFGDPPKASLCSLGDKKERNKMLLAKSPI